MNFYPRVHQKSIRKLKASIREVTSRSNGMGIEERKRLLTQKVRGWVNYFKLADMKQLMQTLGVRGPRAGIPASARSKQVFALAVSKLT